MKENKQLTQTLTQTSRIVPAGRFFIISSKTRLRCGWKFLFRIGHVEDVRENVQQQKSVVSIQEIWEAKEGGMFDMFGWYVNTLQSSCGIAYCARCIRSMSSCALCATPSNPIKFFQSWWKKRRTPIGPVKWLVVPLHTSSFLSIPSTQVILEMYAKGVFVSFDNKVRMKNQWMWWTW